MSSLWSLLVGSYYVGFRELILLFWTKSANVCPPRTSSLVASPSPPPMCLGILGRIAFIRKIKKTIILQKYGCIPLNNKEEKLYKLTKSLGRDNIKRDLNIFLQSINWNLAKQLSQSIKYKFQKFCTEKKGSNNNRLNGGNEIKN